MISNTAGGGKSRHRPLFMNESNSSSGVKSATKFSLKPIPKASALPPPVNAAALLADKQQVKPVEIVAGLIHQCTKVLLGGSSKAGKTWLLLLLALCVATGMKFLRWNTTRCNVLYINLEIQTVFITERLQTLMMHLGISDSGNLDIWNLRGKTADFDALAEQIIKQAEVGNYALIIIDPIYKLMVGKSENMAGGVGALSHQLERIAERTGAALVSAHHFTKGKQTQKKPIDRLSGSGVFGRDADSIILFTDHKEPNCFTVDLVLRNLPPQESFVVEWQYPVMVERQDLEPEGDNGQDDARSRQLLSLLLNNPMPTGEWEAEALLRHGIPHASFFRTKGKLQEGGHIILNTLDKTWGVAAGLVETGDTPDTTDTGDTAAKSGSITNIKVSRETGKPEPKLLGWPDAGGTEVGAMEEISERRAGPKPAAEAN